MLLVLLTALLPAPAGAWLAAAQRWAPYEGGAWRPEQVRQRDGAMSGLWDVSAGPISFAWDPSLCERLLPRFDEDVWPVYHLSCAMLRASLARAMRTWEVGSSHQLWFSESTAPLDAQLAIGGGPFDLAAALDLGVSLAPTYNRTIGFTQTNGVVLDRQPVYAATRAFLAFDTGACWYLDSSVCEHMHSLKESLGVTGALVFVRLVVFGLWTLALTVSLLRGYRVLRRWLELLRLDVVEMVDVDGVGEVDSRELSLAAHLVCGRCCRADRADAAAKQAAAAGAAREARPPMADEHGPASRTAAFLLWERVAAEWFILFELASSMSACALAVRLVCLIAPLVLYVRFLQPCWDCYSFEAAAVHGLGHALGLGHPDDGPGRNMAMNGTHPYDCRDAWAGVHAQPLGETPSVMRPFGQRPNSVCLADDDVAALSVLYPTCGEGRALGSPTCHAGSEAGSEGGLRMIVATALPVAISLAGLLLAHALLVSTHRANRERLSERYPELASESEAKQWVKRDSMDDARRGDRAWPVKPLLIAWWRLQSSAPPLLDTTPQTQTQTLPPPRALSPPPPPSEADSLQTSEERMQYDWRSQQDRPTPQPPQPPGDPDALTDAWPEDEDDVEDDGSSASDDAEPEGRYVLDSQYSGHVYNQPVGEGGVLAAVPVPPPVPIVRSV